MGEDVEAGMLMALEAYREAPTAAAMNAMVTGLQLTTHFEAHVPESDDVGVIALSPNGNVLAMASGRTIQLWDTEAHELQATLFDETCSAAHCWAVTALAFQLPGGDRLVSGDASGIVRQWDVETGSQTAPLARFHDHSVRSLSTTLDGEVLVSSGADGRISAWRNESGRYERKLQDLPDVGAVFSSAVSPDGNFIAAGGVDEVSLIAFATGEVVHQFEGHVGRVMSLAFDGELVVSGDSTGRLGRWDPNRLTGSVVEAHDGAVTSVSMTPDSATAASAGADGAAVVWDVSDRRMTETMRIAVAGAVPQVALDDEGASIFLATTNGVNVLNVEATPRLFDSYPSPDGRPVWAVDFEPGSARIATGAVGGLLTVWTPDPFSVDAEFQAGEEVVRAVKFSTDGVLAAGVDDGSVLWWDDPTTGTTPRLLGHHDDVVRGIDFVGDRVATASSDGRVRVWAPNELVGEHESPVRAVAAHPDEQWIATGGDDAQLSTWAVDA
ncbi:MAG: WD40 repeat domain-containing protein, partial [Acidimicrobiales bacterium]